MSESESKKKAKALMANKDKLEEEIKALTDLLESQKEVGMTESLVDEEQFPRADIDVYSVRYARNRIICLQNDHKALMKDIEEVLYQVHAEARLQDVTHMDTGADQSVPDAASQQTPFAKVDRVDDGSPSSKSGLLVGDELLQFGSISKENFTSLQSIGAVVQHSIGKALSLQVLRSGNVVHLSLTPQTWSGRGLLGCNIVPLKS
ncbi:unnamed protein product [Owenia fusiformis]|uniref:26S proteasome non-ATPase regulatory subunit 9 n=1 Tax=Owenia fusiformis TaxID=6347 RepID=A0A8J1XRM1_OWEFU|nr:unnamed protein product [Owenia fusiformis]